MPDFIGVDVSGIAQLQAKLSKMPEAVQDEVTRAAADETVKYMRVYPPERAMSIHRDGSTFTPARPYRRTFTLKNNWVIVGQGKNEIVVNKTPYAVYVMDDDRQAWMHRPFWKTMAKRMEENAQRLNKIIDTAARKALKKLGLV